MIELSGANETDVREDIAMPFLAALGYARGTEADILRERQLKYGKEFLGRKKDTDPPLRGKADYVLQVLGAARWVLEIKAPDVPLDKDAIEQAISYARHPEVSGAYAALLNGRRFLLFHNTQRADDVPRVDLNIEDPSQLAAALEGVLSPAAIRRDCSPAIVDISTPLGPGLRSTAKIAKGELRRTAVEWESNVPLPPAVTADLDKRVAFLESYISRLDGGDVWRDEGSRIRARVSWALPHAEIQAFAIDKNFMDQRFVALDAKISTDPKKPTIFEVVGSVSIEMDEQMFDVLEWKSQALGAPMLNAYHAQISGWLDGYVLAGSYQAESAWSSPAAPGLRLAILETGEFRLDLDQR